MTLLEQFLQLDIDGYAIGIGQSAEDVTYFCTPVGAEIIGWEGVDGIHYCFLPGYGETVFAVNPMPVADFYVYPLAKNFEEFLRLLLACGGAVMAEQIVGWSKEQFEKAMQEDLADTSEFTQKRYVILNEIAEQFHLKPLAQPYEYVKALQNDFDNSRIRYSAEYYDVLGLENPEQSEESLFSKVISFCFEKGDTNQ